MPEKMTLRIVGPAWTDRRNVVASVEMTLVGLVYPGKMLLEIDSPEGALEVANLMNTQYNNERQSAQLHLPQPADEGVSVC